MSQTWDLLLLSSLTRTLTADAVIRDNTLTRTLTADAIIAASWPLTLITTQPATVTADAVVADHTWYDVSVPVTSSFTADAVIVSGVATSFTRSLTADAVIFSRSTRTFTADAVIAASAPPPVDPGNVPDPGPNSYRLYFDIGPYL